MRGDQLRLVFGVAAGALFVSSLMGEVVLLTLWETDGAGLFPGMLAGTLLGSGLAAWNPWLRRLDVSIDGSGLASAAKAVAIECYPTSLPFALAAPVIAAIVYSLFTLNSDTPSIISPTIAGFGTLIVTALFCFSIIVIVLLCRYSSTSRHVRTPCLMVS